MDSYTHTSALFRNIKSSKASISIKYGTKTIIPYPSNIHLGVTENSVPLNPMVNDHYPYEKWLFHWEYTQHFQTNIHLYIHISNFFQFPSINSSKPFIQTLSRISLQFSLVLRHCFLTNSFVVKRHEATKPRDLNQEKL